MISAGAKSARSRGVAEHCAPIFKRPGQVKIMAPTVVDAEKVSMANLPS